MRRLLCTGRCVGVLRGSSRQSKVVHNVIAGLDNYPHNYKKFILQLNCRLASTRQRLGYDVSLLTDDLQGVLELL